MRYHEFGLFIDGAWRGAGDGGTREVFSPEDDSVIGEVPAATGEDLDAALAAVERMQPVWAETPGWERSAVLRRLAQEMSMMLDEIAVAMSRETGKPLAESAGETRAAIDQFDWYADEARRIFGHTLDGRTAGSTLSVRYEAVGPVAAFTAWNFPALLPARKVAAALAAGCTMILKPSEEAPSSAFYIVEAARRAGLPDGVLNLVTGRSAEISKHLIASAVIRKVSLTGSVSVGKELMRLCADGVKKMSMELGGHAPVLVMPDADPVASAKACAAAKFRNAGQVCISPSRFYVHEDHYEAFSAAMVAVAEGLRIGPGSDPQTKMGPMANSRGRDRIIDLVDDAISGGAELLTGGKVPSGFNSGCYYEPTVLGRVPDAARMMMEEPFGPVAPIATFTDVDDAIERANGTPFGLAAYLFTSDLGNAQSLSHRLSAGMVGVNDMMLATAEAPFGGVKESGFGREGGQLGILDYVEPKYVKLSVV